MALQNDDRRVASRVTAGVSFAAKLAFEHISHAFGPDSETLRDVTLTAEPGEVLCLLGPSGSGKTTLLRIAAGIEVQSAGRVLLNDREIAGPETFMPPERRSIGLVFQDFALFPHLSILDNVRFGLTALSREEARREAMIALERVGLQSYAAAYPHVLGVAAYGRLGGVPSFSNRDDRYVDLAAPGMDIFSLFPRPLTSAFSGCVEQGYSICGTKDYRHADGTSLPLPAAATTSAPCRTAYSTACCSARE